MNLLQSLLEALLFFHPAVWWVSRQIRLEREHCCDDLAAACTGDALDYAQALVELERLRAGNPFHAELAPAARGGSLMLRIRRLLQPQSPAAPLGMKGALFLLLASGAAAVAGVRSGRTEAQPLPAVQVDAAAPIFLPQAAPKPPEEVPATPPAAPVQPAPPVPEKSTPPVPPPSEVAEPAPIPEVVAVPVVATPKANIPLAWTTLRLGFIPLNARFGSWTGKMMSAGEGMVTEPQRVFVEVPPGASFRAKLENSWDSPVQLAVAQDAAWKLGIRFSRRDQSYTNRKASPQVARVSLAQSVSRNVVIGSNDHFSGGGGGEAGPWPFRVDFTRTWDLEAWRSTRAKAAPGVEGLSTCAPDSLSPRFVPSLPSLPVDPEARGLAEVQLILDADGRPLAVQPGTGHPALVAAMTDWAWQLAFEPGKGLPAQGAVVVPLRLNFQREPLYQVPPTVKFRPEAPVYPALWMARNLRGTVVVHFLVGTDGVPTEVKAVSGPTELWPTAVEHAKLWRFNPASRNGKPVAAYSSLEMPFRLR